MRDQDAAPLAHTLRDQLFVERDDGAKIDDFDRLAFGLELPCDLRGQMDGVAATIVRSLPSRTTRPLPNGITYSASGSFVWACTFW